MRGRCAFSTVVLAAISFAGPTVVAGQPKFDHWGIVESLTNDPNTINRPDAVALAQMQRLTDNLLQRGQTYLDLYELQRTLVLDHARFVDSAARTGQPTFGATSYFQARALHEAGNIAEAQANYRKASASGPAALRGPATDWLATIAAGNGSSWQQQLQNWRDGKGAGKVNCPATSTQCALFQAILAQDAVTLLRLQREINRKADADFVDSQPDKDGSTQRVSFYDPLTMYLLAVADFTVVDRLLLNRKELAPFRALALLRIKKYKEAETLLRPLVGMGAAASAAYSPYLGEALFGQKNQSGADQAWQRVTGGGLNTLADIKSSIGIDAPFVARQFANESKQGLARLESPNERGIYLARALLRQNLVPESLDVLTVIRRATAGTSASTVSPSDLTLLAHANYRQGKVPGFRNQYVIARENLVGVAELSPLVGKMLRQLQLVTIVTEGPAKDRDG